MNKLNKIKFNDISVLLVFCIVILAIGIVIFVNNSIKDEQISRANLPLVQLQSEINNRQEFITAPVTPDQYIDITNGDVPPSGYLLRLWDTKEQSEERLKAIEDYPKHYVVEED